MSSTASWVRTRNGKWHFAGGNYPAADVNIRSASDSTFKIVDEEHGNRLVGTVEGNVAFRTVHEGAIYLHEGRQFVVEQLDWENGVARARQTAVDYLDWLVRDFLEPRDGRNLLARNGGDERQRFDSHSGDSEEPAADFRFDV